MTGKTWLRVERPPNRWDSVGAHLPMTLGAGAVLLASAVLPPSGLPFGPTCTFLRWTGYPCPFCGSTRAFIAMGHARWFEAWYQSPLAAALFIGVGAIFLWNAVALAGGLVLRTPAPWESAIGNRRWLVTVILVIVAANWLYRIAEGLR